jgi:hypothetical protein
MSPDIDKIMKDVLNTGYVSAPGWDTQHSLATYAPYMTVKHDKKKGWHEVKTHKAVKIKLSKRAEMLIKIGTLENTIKNKDAEIRELRETDARAFRTVGEYKKLAEQSRDNTKEAIDLAKTYEGQYVCLLTLIKTLPECDGKAAMVAAVKAFKPV